MSNIKKIYSKLSQLDPALWQDSLMSAFDRYTIELKNKNPKICQDQIFEQVDFYANDISSFVFNRIGINHSQVIEAAFKNWCRVASLYEDTLWNNRPTYGRPFSHKSFSKRSRTLILPTEVWDWLETHKNQSEVIRTSLINQMQRQEH